MTFPHQPGLASSPWPPTPTPIPEGWLSGHRHGEFLPSTAIRSRRGADVHSQGACPPISKLTGGGREGGRTGARERPTGGSSDEVSSQELQVPSQDLLSLSSEAGLRTKHPAAVSLSRPTGGDFSELHPPNCEMGAIARSEDGGERAQMKPGGGRLQPESLREKFG